MLLVAQGPLAAVVVVVLVVAVAASVGLFVAAAVARWQPFRGSGRA